MEDLNAAERLQRERSLALQLLQKADSHSVGSFKQPNSPYLDITGLYNDKTVNLQFSSPQRMGSNSFTSEEISGRSTEFSMDQAKKYETPGLDQIFRESICPEIQQMEEPLRHSIADFRSLTADFSLGAEAGASLSSDFRNEDFRPAEKEMDRLAEDERDWEKEFALIPRVEAEYKVPEVPKHAKVKKTGLYGNFEDFSGFVEEASKMSETFKEMSIGQYFQEHSDNVFKIIPNKSPPRRDAVPLLDLTMEAEKENVSMNTQTTITLGKVIDGTESPATFMSKLQKVVKASQKPEVLRLPASPQDKPSLPSASLTRTASQASTSSEFSHNTEAFPIKASHLKLSWGCVKLRTQKALQLRLKNFVNKKVTFRMTVSGPGFQLIPEESSTILSFQPFETRSVTVGFYPTVIGPAIGLIVLEPPLSCPSQRQSQIQLFAYGGKAMLELGGDISSPLSGNPFVDMGSVQDFSTSAQRHLMVYNHGNVEGFALFIPDLRSISKTFDRCAVSVSPSCVVVAPKKYVVVTVSFELRRDELAKISRKQIGRIIKMFSICCIMGDNVTRLRIKKCLSGLSRTVNPRVVESISQNPNISELLKSATEGDQEVARFEDDSLQIVSDLLETFTEETIDVTLARFSDDSFETLDSPDTTINFKSMIMVEPQPESVPVLSLSPKELSLVPCCTKQFYISSESKKAETFEIFTDFVDGLEVFPSEGTIDPGETLAFNVKLRFMMPPSKSLKITVLHETGKSELPVTVLPEGLPPFKQ